MAFTSTIDELRYRIVKRFVRLAEPDAFPAVLHRRRIFILPTGFGIFFSILLFAMLMGSLNYANSLGLILTFLLGGSGLLAMIHNYRNIAGLSVSAVHARPVFAGEVARFLVAISDTVGRDRPAIQARLGRQSVWTDVPAFAAEELTLEVHAAKRGWLPLQRFKLHSDYPLALFGAWSWINPAQKCLVYPKPEVRPPPLPIKGKPAEGGRHERGDEELAGIREYRRGDAGRLIAWKATARTGQLMSKELESQRGEQVVLAWNDAGQANTEQMLSRLAAWVLEADRRGISYALHLPHAQLAMGHGPDHMHQCLKALALYGSQS